MRISRSVSTALVLVCGFFSSANAAGYLDRPSAKYLVDAAFAKTFIDKCPKQLRVRPHLRNEYREANLAFFELFRDPEKRKNQLNQMRQTANKKNCSFLKEHFMLYERSNFGFYRYVEPIR
ncbi:MAG: hypothetical protein IOC64_03390 [Methylobacterium sp.]|nr:hypothetical protein [Methylobacterium sp.]MCA3607593.1 hypothetical protein [Methylobacterium sp.]MCA3610216.1 hypothetical protein [Methylobacterium sp.]MCA3617976.1 hypothetical protein [Methylobacterium sp.]MCA3620956.1 hypothetical protein [Methylobacterium sp.]